MKIRFRRILVVATILSLAPFAIAMTRDEGPCQGCPSAPCVTVDVCPPSCSACEGNRCQ